MTSDARAGVRTGSRRERVGDGARLTRTGRRPPPPTTLEDAARARVARRLAVRWGGCESCLKWSATLSPKGDAPWPLPASTVWKRFVTFGDADTAVTVAEAASTASSAALAAPSAAAVASPTRRLARPARRERRALARLGGARRAPLPAPTLPWRRRARSRLPGAPPRPHPRPPSPPRAHRRPPPAPTASLDGTQQFQSTSSNSVS